MVEIKQAILLAIAAILSILTIAATQALTYEEMTKSYTTSSNQTIKMGVKFIANTNFTTPIPFYIVVKNETLLDNKAYLINISSNTTLATANFSGANATFSNINITPGGQYCIVTNYTGSRTHRSVAGVPFPINRNYINYTNGCYESGTGFVTDTGTYNIVGIYVGTSYENLTITTKNNYTNATINNFNITIEYEGTTTNYNTTIGTITTEITRNNTKTINLTVYSNNYYNETYTNINIGNDITTYIKPYTYIEYVGDTTGIEYLPICTINGAIITTTPGYKPELTNYSTYINCEGSEEYVATNFTVTQTTQNWSLTLNEYNINLQFSSNTTGKISWQLPNDNGKCCSYPTLNETSGFNLTSFQYIKSVTQFADEDRISIYFNPKNTSGAPDDAAQYYEWINEYGEMREDNIKVLDEIDKLVWVNTYNYGNNRIYDATVIFRTYDNDSGTSYGRIVNQRITRPLSGTSAPGTPFFIQSNLTYWISTTREGYICETIIKEGIDLENDGILDIKCRPQIGLELTTDRLYGPTNFNDEITLRFIFTTTTPTLMYFYNTTYNATLAQLTINNRGTEITLNNASHYTTGNNFTIEIYSYNATSGGYDTTITQRVNSKYRNVYRPIDEIEDSTTIAAIVWIALIIAASIIGHTIKKADETPTGYYILGIGSLPAAAISPTLLPVAIIFALTALGGMLFSTTRD